MYFSTVSCLSKLWLLKIFLAGNPGIDRAESSRDLSNEKYKAAENGRARYSFHSCKIYMKMVHAINQSTAVATTNVTT